jgi:alpha-galactosidase
MLLDGASARVVLASGEDGASLGLKLDWQVTRAGDTVRLRLVVENPLPHGLAVERLDILVWPNLPPATQVLQPGYMSWSRATPLVPLEQVQDMAAPPVAMPSLPATEAERFLAAGMTLLGWEDGRTLLVGFTGARDYQPMVALQPDWAGRQRLTASCLVEGVVLPAGGRLVSEPLLLLFDRPEHDALEVYARETAREMRATPWPTVTTGWCSWYEFFTEVTPDDMLRNLDALEGLQIEVVQLDDGYQTEIGDWLSLNQKFSGGLRPLVDRIHARGLQAGLWLAPFYVGERSQVFREHRDWLVKDAAGLPIGTLYNWDQRNFSLDTTHPGVQAHLREVFRTIVEDWGFDYLKLDFIYAGAIRGVRHDRTKTGVQAYRLGLELVREVVGGRFVLGCGAPFLASVGLVHGMRVSPDTAPDWGGPDPVGVQPALVNAIRSTLAHHWMHGHWWVNDPDCLIVRRHDSRLTEAEVYTWATVVLLSGGMVLSSDDLTRLEPERLAILKRLLPPMNKAARPFGPYRDGLPARLELELAGGDKFVAFFNWTDKPRPAPVADADFWTGSRGEIPAHGVRLVRLSTGNG